MSDSVYVQHIEGYDGGTYEERARKMRAAGFIRLRSDTDEKGQYWEIWYLPGPWRAEGPLKGAKTAADVSDWLRMEIHPGEIELKPQHWGLSVD